jgi:hypothetical protein
MSVFARTPQLQGAFVAGHPASGYYSDLRAKALDYGTPEEAAGWLGLLLRRRERAWPVTVIQLGLGAWQLASAGDDEWRRIVSQIADWLVVDMDARGRLMHLQPMPHTFPIEAPWPSAMAQGEAASLLVRAAELLERPELLAEARRAIAPLLTTEVPLDGAPALVVLTDDGPVLQEYPCNPASHVLNGWIFALWGLYDVAAASGERDGAEAREAFAVGARCLAARLPLYETGRGWSRYDLYPHPLTNVASPFYHRLHVEQLRALHELEPRREYLDHAERWERALESPIVRASAVARKVGFRLVRPRRKAA